MKTMAPDAPTSHTSARCKASTPGAAVIDGREPPAVAAYAITHSRNSTKQLQRYFVIACDKREAFAQGSDSDEAIHLSQCGAMDCFAALAMTARSPQLNTRSRSWSSAP